MYSHYSMLANPRKSKYKLLLEIAQAAAGHHAQVQCVYSMCVVDIVSTHTVSAFVRQPCVATRHGFVATTTAALRCLQISSRPCHNVSTPAQTDTDGCQQADQGCSH